MKTTLISWAFFLFSCSDDSSNEFTNEIQVYSDECQFSFTLKTTSYSTGRYDSDCEFEKIARFYKVPSDTIYYEATAGKRKNTGKIYHAGRITQIEINF
jgi:hypothetical protein